VCAPLGAFCALFGTEGSGRAWCLAECELGKHAKCGGRQDVACVPIGERGEPVCAPVCASDDQCAPRFCDTSTGLCVDKRPEGSPLYSECEAGAQTTGCAGQCFAVAPGASSGPGVCTGLCVLGAPDACGRTRMDSLNSGRVGFCAPATMTTGAGDVGLC